ncbi:AAA family ATPase [Dysosmobacter segnis]|jgi:twinkle protein|uniref:AAA family ATPase n=1 Tax=Dysosmobacter segnis TaxID=2763042 RepID=A0A923MHT3_9FIRM|nr:AAA family ATPase [Dysosmobacter segnis]MCC2172122.1 AAA family ATPase [Hominicoprocola fusiformis]
MQIDREAILQAKEKLGDRNAQIIVEELGITDFDEKNMKCCCPFHQEDHASFIYNKKAFNFRCFGSCGRSYDILDVFMYKGATYAEACKKLFELAEMPYSFGELGVKTKRHYRYPHEVPCTDKSKVYAYFEQRKISRETLDALDVRQDSEGNAVFNYYDTNDVLTMVKYKPSHKVQHGQAKCWCQQNSDTAPLLFNMNRINVNSPLLICEGEPDCLSAIEAGFKNAVSVPLGSSNLHWIDENLEWLDQFESIIICADNDDAGVKMQKECVPRLGSWRTKVVDIPAVPIGNTGRVTKDLNEILYVCGKDKVLELILDAKDSPVPSVADLSDVEPTEYEDVDGVTTGLKAIDDELMRLFFGTLTIVSGQPGSGKSSLLTQLACNSLDNDIGTWLFSGELPNGVEKSWFNYIFAGPRNITDAISRRGNPYKKISTTTLAEINKTYKGRWHIYRDDYDNTLDKLIASMTDTVRKYGARCLILDNFMCIDTETSEEELRSQTDTIKKLIEFAKKYQVAVILVCHPRKMDAGTNVGIYDIAGTSNIVNLAHRTIGLRRVTDAERENAAKYSEKRRQLLKYDVIVTIVKDRMFGRQNIDVGLYYDPASRRFFSDMDEYDRRFSWDKKEYKEPLPLPPQLLAEERASEDEAFGAVNDREG